MEFYTEVAALVAGVLTYCDLDTVFDAPPHALQWGPWLRLCAWWWGFVFANAILAGCLFCALRDTYFKSLNPWLGGARVRCRLYRSRSAPIHNIASERQEYPDWTRNHLRRAEELGP